MSTMPMVVKPRKSGVNLTAAIWRKLHDIIGAKCSGDEVNIAWSYSIKFSRRDILAHPDPRAFVKAKLDQALREMNESIENVMAEIAR